MKKYIAWLAVVSLYLSGCNNGQCDAFLTSVLKTEGIGCIDRTYGKTFFAIRPQDSNSARRLMHIAQEGFHDTYSDHNQYGFDLSFSAQRSFSKTGTTLGSWFLFNGTPSISVGIPTDTAAFDVDGRQIGLFNANTLIPAIGTLSLSPAIKNNIIDFSLWFDLPCVHPGFVLRTDFTVVNTKTNLGVCSETENAQQSGIYPTGFYTINCTPTPIQYTSIIEAFIGNKTIGTYTSGDVDPLYFGKYFCGDASTTTLASIRVDAGIDFIRQECGFFNASACVVAPVGTRPAGRCVFEPVVGANRAWQVGLVALGEYNFNAPVSIYADATVTHLCKSKQTRLFALNNGAGSQYMLFKEFDPNLGEMVERAANILAGDAKIGAALMVDASFMMHYTHNQFFFDLGYNLWFRSQEKLADVVAFRNLNRYMLGIKGDTYLSSEDTDSGFCVENFCTQSRATLGRPAPVDVAPNGDCDTRYISLCDVDFTAPLHPAACSNKIFGSFGYAKECTQRNTPFHVMLEWELEFGHSDKAISQWGLGLDIGSSF